MPESDQPLFRRIAADLRDAIRRDEYLPGHQLPSGTALAAQYKVAAQTVWHVINLLRAEGLVVGLQSAGVFVAKPRMKYYASLTGSRAKRLEADRRRDTFTQQIEAQGKTARRVSTVEEFPADGEVAEHLHVQVGIPVAVRRRVMYADDEPLQLGDSYYPLDVVRDSKIMNPADITEGIDQVLENLGYVPTRYEGKITWRMPTPDETEKLAIAALVHPRHCALLLFTRRHLPPAALASVSGVQHHDLRLQLLPFLPSARPTMRSRTALS